MRDAFESDPIGAAGALRARGRSHGCVTMEIDRMTAEELNEAIRPICSAFIAKVWLRQRARTA